MHKIVAKFTFTIFLSLLWGIPFFGKSQDYHFANSFNVENGLPSDHIYEICEDSKGFLWIATDNGIARFDGKNFYNYTIKNGLPSNDVLQVVMEKDGTIWVNCYKETPAYFDETNNCFVNFEGDEKIVQISNTLLEYFLPPSGGIRFYGNLQFVDFKNKKVAKVGSQYSPGYLENDGNQYEIQEYSAKTKQRQAFEAIDLYLNDKLLRQIDTLNTSLVFKRLIRNNHYLTFEKNGRVTRYGNFSNESPLGTKEVVQIQERIKWCSVSHKYLNVIATSGNVYIYDLETLQFLRKINTPNQINSVFIDRNENIWLGSIDQGMLSYKNTPIQTISSNNETFSNNLLSISSGQDGKIFAGNYKGQLLKYSANKTEVKHIKSEMSDIWLRKIIQRNDQLYIFCDDGYSLNTERTQPIFYNQSKFSTSIKSAFLLNTETIIVGSINGLYALSTKDQQQQRLKSPSSRFLYFTKINDYSFYTVDADGLVHYDFLNEKYYYVDLKKYAKKNKPSALTVGPKHILWLATVKGDLLFLQNENVVDIIHNDAGLPENITDLLMVGDDLWIASKSGIFILNYSFSKGKLKYSIHKIAKSMGLSSDVVNELSLNKNQIYAATNNGISIIPSHIQFSKSEIVPTVISIRINNKKVPIANRYKLAKDEKNVILQLAGAELSGHFKNFEYVLNNNGKWTELEGNTLNFTLRGGENSILIRAIDDNNNISKARLKLVFVVAIPFYNKIWFWALVVFALTGIVFWIYSNRKLNRQQESFQQKLELERQRNKITADLHDDIGATLSSLQINSMVANQLIDRSPSEVKSVLQKIENQAENLADKIGDIIWSMKPGKEEFISLSMRVKNFANDILGSTNIKYKIEYDPILDTEIQDITMRKNIVLFFKEAINNAAKYSAAKMVMITMDFKDEIIHLKVQDDGKGFQIDHKAGNGISNMKNRIEELKGEFEIISEPNQGTIVKAFIPINISSN